MVQRKPRLRIARFPPGYTPPPLAVSDPQWSRIEKAYGHKLSVQVREDLLEASRQFLERVEGETFALPVDDVIQEAEEILDAAVTLFDRLAQAKEGGATDWIDERFSPQSALRINAFTEMLKQFADACELALSDLADPSNRGGWKDGSEWSRWIKDLTSIAERHGLPAEVRKDSDRNRSGVQSPFLYLVFELQSFFPGKYRRPRNLQVGMPRDDLRLNALATAIANARAGSGRKSGGKRRNKTRKA